MIAGLRNFLGVGAQTGYVREYMAKVNMEVLSYQTVFFAILSFLTVLSTLTPLPLWVHRTPEALSAYRIGFSALCAVNLVFHAMSRWYLGASDARPTMAYLIAYSHVPIVVGIGMAITLYDFPSNQSFFVYVMSLVIVFGLLYIPPAITLTITVASTVVMLAVLAHIGYYGFVYHATLIAYAFIVTVVSAANFHSRLRAGRASGQVISLSLHDELTGMKNRRALNEDSEQLVGSPVFLMVGDIDDFKFYNDSYGHASGDGLLQRFALSLQSAFGADSVYRFGGDEFVVVAQTDSLERFERMVGRWHESFADVEVNGTTFSPTTSAGYIGGTVHSTEEFQNMLRIADMQLYAAKQGGKNKVVGMMLEGRDAARLAAELASDHQSSRAGIDGLTGLPSVMYFTTHAKTLLSSPALAGSSFSFVYFNVANLKIYNERFGFEAGNDLLVHIARTIDSCFEHGLLSRFGDDRFVLLTYGDGLIEGIERVHDAVLSFNEESSTVIRAGIYAYEPGIEVSSACDRAKLACDYIKGRYNAYYYFYEDELLAARNRQQYILDHFESALKDEHVKVYYQPILRTIGPRICEFEALARWIEPDGDMVSPDDFVPVLEEFRLVHRMDLHILEQICKNYRKLVDEGVEPVPTNINISRLDMELCDIAAEVERTMKRYGVPASMIHIEVTESAFSENQGLLSTVIDRFHELGMEVWMDDFGSGYSSLNVLREFDFDVVKIDLRFLSNESKEGRERSKMMIPHIVSMAKELGIQTLAEGVETRSQYEFLKSIACEKVQGYAFDEPAPFEHMRELLLGEGTAVEGASLRPYFDTIGRVDLLRPLMGDANLARDIELSSGLPTAVIEFRGKHVRYLLWNSSYLDYLADIGMGTIESSEAKMNDLSRVQSQAFFSVADRYYGKPEWLTLTFYEDKDLCTAMARCVSVDEGTGACSFVYIAFNVSKYLERTGSSLPDIRSKDA